MKVDNIIIDKFIGSAPAGGVFRFYDKNGDVIRSGKIEYNSTNFTQTENFIILAKSVWDWSPGEIIWAPVYAFYTEESTSCIPVNNHMYIGSINDKTAYLKIKFRTPIEISYMECNFRCTNGSGNNASATGGNITINYVTGVSKTITVDDTNSPLNNITKVNFPEHQTGIHQMIKTTVDSRINNISKVNGFYVNCDIPEDTAMKFVLSIDGINYKKYDFLSNSWININLSADEIMNNGMTRDELQSITKSELDQLINYNSINNFDFAVSMVTNQSYCTPVLTSINILYIEVSE